MRTIGRRAFGVAWLLAGWMTLAAVAAPLPEASPESVGLSTARLAAVDATVQRWLDRKEIPGAVVMVARHGKLAWARHYGAQDVATGVPMRDDALFRWYSMTKPIVSVAAMQMVEEGRLGLHEPVAKYLPEFKDMRVAVEGWDAATLAQTFTTVPAKRAITVADLLRHTSGLTYGVFAPFTQVKKLYGEAGLQIVRQYDGTLADYVQRLAKIPLVFEPGTRWEYGHSTDVLGRVLEVADGRPLDVLLAARIFEPLKMHDTAFGLKRPEDMARVVQPRPDAYTGQVPELIDLSKPSTLFAGGHGLVGTAGDYLRFAQMLVNGGTLDGVRILSRRTVAWMASNHLHAGIALDAGYLPGPGYGFGLGFAVRKEAGIADWHGSPGDYYWGGYGGTAFWVDPKEDLVAVFMTQEPLRRQHYRNLMRNTIYGAVVD
ncbi:MAG: beta-lactamase family protein [Burkholderiales bacterium]|nr:beta-lactamase family protein [Burkholderiales bacterium]